MGNIEKLNFDQIELFIFDMDGLLLDTERISAAIWADALQLDRQQVLDVYSNIVGKNRFSAKQYLRCMFPTIDVDAFTSATSDRLIEYYQKNGIPHKRGVLALLNNLKKIHKKMCVATSTSSRRALFMLEKSEIIQYFDEIICGDMVERGKPDPEIFLKAAQMFSLCSERCLVLEDSPVGVESAFNAGMQVVLVPDVIIPDQKTLEHATVILSSLEELLPYVNTGDGSY